MIILFIIAKEEQLRREELMYIAFGRKVIDSAEIAKVIEENSEFKVIKDMSKGSKREDVIAFNLSVNVNILREILKDDYNPEDLNDEELFEEYLTLSEEIATDIEEYLPEESILDIKAYKWDESDNDIKLVILIIHEDLGELKLRDIMKRLLSQVE